MPRHHPSAPYSAARGLIRMSWNKYNLYNLSRMQEAASGGAPGGAVAVGGDVSAKTVYQQKWYAKRWTRGYHGDRITERRFQRMLDSRLPVVSKAGGGGEGNAAAMPVHPAALTYRALERRIDVLLFRALLAPSVYAARQLVRHGKVAVNGVTMPYPSLCVKDGDMVSVRPEAIWMLNQPQTPPVKEEDLKVDEASEPADGDVAMDAAAGENTATGKDAENDAATSAPIRPKFAAPHSLTPPKWNDASIPGLRVTYKPYSAPFMFIPEYLEVDFATCSVVFLREPKPHANRVEIPSPFSPEVHALAHEFYARGRR